MRQPSTERPESTPSNEKLIRSITEAAQHIGAITLTFLAVCVYIGIAVASTNHEVLLLGKSINLPLFDVEIPLDKFFILAPALLFLLHLHLLILEYLLQAKISRFVRDPNPPEQETDLLFASLPLSIFLGQGHPTMIRWFLNVLSKGVTIALPIVLLLATQVTFLPYHSGPITTWHKLLILLDIGMIWYFLLRTPDYRIHSVIPPPGDEPKFARFSTWKLVGGVLVTFCLVGFSTVVAGGRATGYEFRKGEHCPFTDLFAVDLSLIDHMLTADQSSGEGTSSKRGIQLIGRDLRGADFTDAELVNADFRGSDLTGAIFRNADLRNANFSPYRRVPRFEVPRKTTSETLVGTPTVLRGADLRGALLSKANLSRADLRWAHMENSDLYDADLSHADLRGASLREANLVNADLSSSRLTGADLWRALLHWASLRETDLRGTKLVEVKAVAADFTLADTLAADFRDASLYRAYGLILEGVDFNRAKLGKVHASCGEGTALRSPKLSDLRSIALGPIQAEDWEEIRTPFMEKEKDNSVYQSILVKLNTFREEERERESMKELDKKESRFCLVILEQGPDLAPKILDQLKEADLLYSKSQMQDWPDPEIGESEYYTRLAKELVNRACSDYDLIVTLIRDLSGEMAPMRPLLASVIARGMSERLKDQEGCDKLWSLSEEQKATIQRIVEKDPLRTDDPVPADSSGISGGFE